MVRLKDIEGRHYNDIHPAFQFLMVRLKVQTPYLLL